MLEALSDALKLVDKDLASRPLPANHAIRSFVDSEVPFNDEQAEKMKTELVSIWPELACLEITNIRKLHHGLVNSAESILLEYHLIREFLLEVDFRLTHSQLDTDEAITGLVRDMYHSVKRITPPLPSNPSILT